MADPCEVVFAKVAPESTQSQGTTPTTLYAIVRGATATSYQWFRGSSGDTSDPLGITTPTADVVVTSPGTTAYWVRVGTTECGTRDSVTGYVQYASCPEPPPANGEIQQSHFLHLCNGQTYGVSVGTANADQYLWRFDHSNGSRGGSNKIVSGLNTNAITISVDLGVNGTMGRMQYGTIWSDVRNSCNSSWTDFATVFGYDPPHPVIAAPDVVIPGQATQASVNPTNEYPLAVDVPVEESYAWSITNGTIVSGQGTPNITFISTNGNSTLGVTTTNPCGGVSASKTTTACTPAAITRDPDDVSMPVGETAYLSIHYVSPSAATVQWYRGPSGDTSDPIFGATSTTLGVVAVEGDVEYWAQVTTSCNTAASQSATVTGTPQPPQPGRRRSARH